MDNMQMDVGEIRRSYKAARDKKVQIRILADLNQCSRRDIERIVLNEAEGDPSAPASITPLPGRRGSHIKDPETVEKVAREYLAGGITLAEVGDIYGISTSTVSKMVKRYKERQAAVETDTADMGDPLAPDEPLAATAETASAARSALDDLFNAVRAMMERVERDCADFEMVHFFKNANSRIFSIEKDDIRIDMERTNTKEEGTT